MTYLLAWYSTNLRLLLNYFMSILRSAKTPNKYASIHSVIKLGLSWPHYCKIKGAAYEVNSQYVVLAFVRRFLSAWPAHWDFCPKFLSNCHYQFLYHCKKVCSFDCENYLFFNTETDKGEIGLYFGPLFFSQHWTNSDNIPKTSNFSLEFDNICRFF